MQTTLNNDLQIIPRLEGSGVSIDDGLGFDVEIGLIQHRLVRDSVEGSSHTYSDGGGIYSATMSLMYPVKT